MDKNNIIAQRKNKTIYREGNTVIKLFDDSFTNSAVLNEALNQSRVYETGLNVPKLIEVTKIDGRWAIISEYVEGQTLSELMSQNPDKRDEYIKLFVDTQMLIQAHSSPLLSKIKDKMKLKINATNFDDNTKYELLTRLESMPKHSKICHGDYNPDNIIITPNGAVFILDWSHVTQGNASADIARSYLLFRLNEQFEIAEKYIELFCKKSGTRRKYVEGWIPIVAASQSVKGNEKEREFLARLVDVVEYE